MKWVYMGLAVYMLGFVLILTGNVLSGPVTPALSLLRATVWPLWIATGIPRGYRGPMD